MRRSTHLLKSNAEVTENRDGMGFPSFGGGGLPGGSLNFGGGSFGGGSFGSNSFNFGGDFGSSFGQNDFSFGSDFGGGGGSFGSSDFNFDSTIGFNSSNLMDQNGNFSFDPSFSVGSLNQSAFGQGSPLAQGSFANSSNPNQGDVPQVDDWKEFVGFLFKNGPAWVRAFRDGQIQAPQGARRSAPSGSRKEVIQRYIQQRRRQMANGGGGGGGGAGGGVGSFLTSTPGILAIGALAVAGVIVVSSGGGGRARAVPYRRRPSR